MYPFSIRLAESLHMQVNTRKETSMRLSSLPDWIGISLVAIFKNCWPPIFRTFPGCFFARNALLYETVSLRPLLLSSKLWTRNSFQNLKKLQIFIYIFPSPDWTLSQMMHRPEIVCWESRWKTSLPLSPNHSLPAGGSPVPDQYGSPVLTVFAYLRQWTRCPANEICHVWFYWMFYWLAFE